MVSSQWERPVLGVNPHLQHDHWWGLSWTSGCDFNLRRDSAPEALAVPVKGTSPPTRARPPTCWLLEQRPKGMNDVTWICPEVRLSELKLWPQQWSPASLWDWTDGVQGMDPHPGPTGWRGGGEGDTCSSHWLCWAAPWLIHSSHCHLTYWTLVSLAQVDSEVILSL